MSLNGKFLDKDHLQYFWTKIKMKFASAEQGAKADTALQQSDVTSTYSSSGTAPVNGTAVNAALGTLDASSVGGSGKYISAISETGGKIYATPETMDTVPISGSTKAVTSGGVQAPLAEVVDAGSKNLYPPFETQSSKGGTGVTYSYSGGIVYAKGTKSSSLNYIDVVENSKISELGLKVGDVIKLYNTSDNLRLGVLLGDGTTFDPAITVGNEIKEVTIGIGKTYIYIRAQILSSFTGTVDFSATPMICTKAKWDISHEYVPYGKTNAELTNENDSQQSEIDYAVNTGVKNYCPKETETSTGSGFTADVEVNIPAGTYILSFTGTLAYTASLSLYRALPHSGNSLANINLSATTGTQSVEFTISEAAKYIAFYHNGSGNSLTNIMIRPASITDSTFVLYAKTNRELTVENASQQSEIDYVINTGVKNLLNINLLTLNTGIYGLTSRNIGEGKISISASNGVTQTADYLYSSSSGFTNLYGLKAGESYIVSNGIFRDGHVVRIDCSTNGTSWNGGALVENVSGEARFTVPSNATGLYIRFRVTTAAGTFTNVICTPMIRPDEITDQTYSPYALPNPTLTPAAIKAVDEGSKNIADMSKTSFTLTSKDGVQVSLSGDTLTSVGTGGTSTNNFFNIFFQQNTVLIPVGTWVASLHGTGTGNFRIEEFDDVNGTALKGEFGKPFTFTIPENATLSYIRITSKPSTNCAGTFKLMICTASDWAVSPKFVPYAPTNRELYEMIQALQNNS